MSILENQITQLDYALTILRIEKIGENIFQFINQSKYNIILYLIPEPPKRKVQAFLKLNANCNMIIAHEIDIERVYFKFKK